MDKNSEKQTELSGILLDWSNHDVNQITRTKSNLFLQNLFQWQTTGKAKKTEKRSKVWSIKRIASSPSLFSNFLSFWKQIMFKLHILHPNLQKKSVKIVFKILIWDLSEAI